MYARIISSATLLNKDVSSGGGDAGGVIDITGAISTPSTISTTSELNTPAIASATGILTIAPLTKITNGTPATSVGTGALQVSGGMSAAGEGHFAATVITPQVRTNGLAISGTNPYSLTGYDCMLTRTDITATTGSSSTTSGALRVAGGVGVGGNINAGGTVKVNSTTESTTNTTGALTVAGGAGIAGNLNTGGTVKVNSTTESTTNTTGALTVAGGAGIAGNLNTGGTVKVASTTQSTTNTTGALTVAGGAGIAGNLNVGGEIKAGTLTVDTTNFTSLNTPGDLDVAGTTTLSGPLFAEDISGNALNVKSVFIGNIASPSTADLTIEGDINQLLGDSLLNNVTCTSLRVDGGTVNTTAGDLTLDPFVKTTTAKPVAISSTAAASSNTTGALTVSGGVGIEGNLYVGGTLNATTLNSTASSMNLTDTTASTNTTTGALRVAGGVGVVGNVNVGGTLVAGSTLTTPQIGTASGDLTLAPAGTTTTAQRLLVTNTTASTSGTTGALVVSGGIGTNGAVCSNTIVRANSYLFSPEVRTTTTDLLLAPGATGKVTTTRPINTSDTTAATSKTTGALTVSGGVGVSGDIYGTTIVANNTFMSHGGNWAFFKNGAGAAELQLLGGEYNLLTGTTSVKGNSSNLTLNGGTGTHATNGIYFLGGGTTGAQPALRLCQLTSQNFFLPDVDNNMILGGAGNRWKEVYSVNGTVQTSGETLKDEITQRVPGLKQLEKVKTLQFTWKQDVDEMEDDTPGPKAAGKKRKRKHFGLSAENLKTLFPDMVRGDTPDQYGVVYSEMIPILVRAVQELSEELKGLKGPQAKRVKK